jgi:presenilin-like A22 family membrane protease
VITTIIVAFIIEVARGHDGSPYAWLGAIAGLAYLVAIVVLRLRS